MPSRSVTVPVVAATPMLHAVDFAAARGMLDTRLDRTVTRVIGGLMAGAVLLGA